MRILLRKKPTASLLSEIYEWRQVENKYCGKSWYLIHRDNMVFPRLNPDVGAFIRDLFTRLKAGETVKIEAEYNLGSFGTKLVIALPAEWGKQLSQPQFSDNQQGTETWTPTCPPLREPLLQPKEA